MVATTMTTMTIVGSPSGPLYATEASHPSPPMITRNNRMMKTVLRLLRAIAEYMERGS